MGCALDVGFLCDKAAVVAEDITDVLYYMSTAMQNLSQTYITGGPKYMLGVVNWRE